MSEENGEKEPALTPILVVMVRPDGQLEWRAKLNHDQMVHLLERLKLAVILDQGQPTGPVEVPAPAEEATD